MEIVDSKTSTEDDPQKAVGLARRVFFYVPTEVEDSVVRCRPDRTFKTLTGIRKLHCVKTTAEQEGSSFKTALVTALTASVVIRRTAAIRNGWTAGRRSD